MQKHIITLLCAAGMIISSSAIAENLKVKPNAPEKYTVKKGDTLWDISGKYLYRPWKWPALWRANRHQIANPHLIYPGQVLVLRYVDGQPVLEVEGIPTIKLSPQIRDNGSGYGINTIDVDFYTMFMKHAQFVSQDELQKAGRLVAGPENKILYNIGDRVYADGLSESGNYLIVRYGHPLKNPVNGHNLGVLVEFVGEAATLPVAENQLSHRTSEAQDALAGKGEYVAQTSRKDVVVRTAQPMIITNIVSEITRGDYLIPKPEDLTAFQMMPHEPETEIDANIVEVLDGISETAMMRSIIINKGSDDGLDKGTVLGIYKRGQVVKSDWRNQVDKKAAQYVNTPVEEVGLAMVYRVGKNVASAIILESTTNVNKDDLIANPGRDLNTFGKSQVKKYK